MTDNKLDKFGQFFIENMIDKGIEKYYGLAKGEYNAPSLQTLQNQLSKFNPSELEVIRQLVLEVLVSASHDFLFAVQESDNTQILVDDENIAELSDGLHGELFSESGWLKTFSSFSDQMDE